MTRRTVVVCHAHPDDEALLTSGTMARAASEGHRVVMVVATDGDVGNVGDGDVRSRDKAAENDYIAARRLDEARASARVLGAARVEHLGYADSGKGPELYPDPPGRTRFVRAPVDEAAERLAAILREEQADVLLSDDRNGGYGHPDHVRVHEVSVRAAELAGTPRRLEATIPREPIRAAAGIAAKVFRVPVDFVHGLDHAYSARSEITHRVSVRQYAALKRASLRAHASQTAADGGADRTLAALLRIPRPLYDLIFRQEWFIDPCHRGPISDDIFDGLP